MADGLLAKAVSGATVRVGADIKAPGPTGKPETTAVALVVPTKDRLALSSGGDVDVAAEAAKLKAKAEAAGGSPAFAAAKALFNAGKEMASEYLPKEATDAEKADAKKKTDNVMKRFDPKNTGFVAGESLQAWVKGTGGTLEATMAFADADKDGKLSRAEIQGAYEKMAAADNEADLGAALGKYASIAAKSVFNGATQLADTLGLRHANPAQVAEAKAKTETVMKFYDPKATGFVGGEQLAAWTGGKDKVKATLDYSDTDKDGKLSTTEVQKAFERKAMDRDTSIGFNLGAKLKINGGADVNASVRLNGGLKPGQKPRISGEINVGPDVLRIVRQMAYQQTRQAIRNRQMPVINVPESAKAALQKLGAYNKGGSMDGAMAVNLNNPALIEAVRQGVTQGIKDQPFRNRFLLRPEGMWRLRARIAEAPKVQTMIVTKVRGEVARIEREVEVLANGVVVFQQIMPARTGGHITYHGDGYDATLSGEIQDAARWMPK